jgi:hypothetical protein
MLGCARIVNCSLFVINLTFSKITDESVMFSIMVFLYLVLSTQTVDSSDRGNCTPSRKALVIVYDLSQQQYHDAVH